MVNKLVKNLNDDIWRKFAGICKVKGKYISEELENILEEYIERNIKK